MLYHIQIHTFALLQVVSGTPHHAVLQASPVPAQIDVDLLMYSCMGHGPQPSQHMGLNGMFT